MPRDTTRTIHGLNVLHGWVLMLLAFGVPSAHAQDGKAAPTAAERMSARGPEQAQLEASVGTWQVTSRLKLTPDAQPIIATDLIAERTMVGAYLQETIMPAPGSKMPDFKRIAYLTYSRVEGRWQYVSLDTRFPVGIMPAYSYDKQSEREVKLLFESLGFVGLGEQVDGRFMRSDLVLTRASKDHDFARQHWIVADGTGREWLAVEYEYKRK